MPDDVSPQTVADRILFALSEHLVRHGDIMRIQHLPAPQGDCKTCVALVAAVQEAEALVALGPPAARVVPAPSIPRRRGAA